MNLSKHPHSATRMLEPTNASRRPRIALVLGSGGVRSAAAIGVAEVLENAGLSPDLVVGCSSGALFGAIVASRMSADEAMARAVKLWSADLTRRHRWKAYAQLLLPRLAGFNADFSLRHSSAIAERVAEAFGAARIEDLPVSLRVVATSADTGSRAVLHRGPLVDALCASMAVPFIFPPVQFGGERLVDGVICDPLPVSAAYDADVILTLGFEGRLPLHIDRPAKLFGRVSTTLINNLMEARLDACRATGKTLVPVELRLSRRVGLWDTAALPAMREAGRTAMNMALPQLRQSLNTVAYAASRTERVPA
jgi:NTE family protein